MTMTYTIFIVCVILAAIGGFYYHEAYNEKLAYEDCNAQIEEYMNLTSKFEKINWTNTTEVKIYGK